MPSLWGSKTRSPDGADEAENPPRTSDEHVTRRAPTERDRLLPAHSHPPHHPHADGYLDPDDPAVSSNPNENQCYDAVDRY